VKLKEFYQGLTFKVLRLFP